MAVIQGCENDIENNNDDEDATKEKYKSIGDQMYMVGFLSSALT